jgi:uncharacterized protein
VTTLGIAALVSLIVFSGNGDVDWRVASLLAIGSIAGAFLGAQLALGPHAAKWVFRLLILVLGLEVVRLGLRLWSPTLLTALPLLHNIFQVRAV